MDLQTAIKRKLGNLARGVSSFIQNPIRSAQTGIQNWATANPKQATNIINAPANITQAVTEPITSIPYRISQNKINEQSKGLYNYPEKYFPQTPVFQSRQPPEQFQNREPNMSYVPENLINIVPQKYPQLEAIKRKVLGGENIRPSAREYLKQVPITFREQGILQNTYRGVSSGKGTPFREIGINPNEKMDSQQLEDVIKHELLHQTPNLVPKELFHPKNKQVISGYTQRWGQQYFKNPKALVEEMFANQDLPPAYYWHIFKEVNPKATKENFINHLKSYFVNNINNPPPQLPRGGNGQQGISVPGTGGGPVYGLDQ